MPTQARSKGVTSSAVSVDSRPPRLELSLDRTKSTPLVSDGLPPAVEQRLPRTVLERYVRLELIGRGGMGTVLRAYDPMLHREVALKLMRAPRDRGEGTLRLIAEARAMASVAHPNIVEVYDVGVDESEHVVLVMEYVQGTTLATWLSRERRSVAEILQHFRAAGRGLAAAHAGRLLHRDFKPANVLVSERGLVKVTDFGLARAMSAMSFDDSDHHAQITSDADMRRDTEASAGAGTPRYMAPEQHMRVPLSPAADQYAFCVALWTALCGAAPFIGPDLLASKAAGPPVWPDGTRVPRRIVRAIRRGLAVAPARRWPSMDDLLRELDVAPESPRVSRKTIVTLTGCVALGAGGLALWSNTKEPRCSGGAEQLVGIWDDSRKAVVRDAFAQVGVVYANAAWQRTEADLDAYAEQWRAQHLDACAATTLRGELSTDVMDQRMGCLRQAKQELLGVTQVLEQADAAVVQHAHEMVGGLVPLTRCSDLARLAEAVEPPLEREAVAVEQARETLAHARAESAAGRFDAANLQIERARVRLEGLRYGPVKTSLAISEARVLEQLGKLDEAEGALRRALELAAQHHQHVELQRAALQLMRVLGRRARFSEAWAYRELAQATIGRDELADSELRRILATLRAKQGDFAGVEGELLDVLAMRERLLGPHHIDVAVVRNDLVTVLTTSGDLEAAEHHARVAIEQLASTLGEEHPNVAVARSNLSLILHNRGRLDEAEQEAAAALDLHLRLLGDEHPDVARSHNNLGRVYGARDKLDQAEREFKAAVATARKQLGDTNPETAGYRSNLGVNYLWQQKFAEAEDELRAVLVVEEGLFGAAHPRVAASRANLGAVLLERGKSVDAELQTRLALRGFRGAFGEGHPAVAQTRGNLGEILFRQGRLSEAELEYRAALAIRERALDEQHTDVAWSRTKLAQALIERRSFDEALALAEMAWASRDDDQNSTPAERAETAFTLARALWGSKATTRDHARARGLAQRAFELYRDGAIEHRNELDAIAAWLRDH